MKNLYKYWLIIASMLSAGAFAQSVPPVPAPPQAPEVRVEKADTIEAATVEVQRGKNSGTGVVVACEDGHSLVLTNRHVIEAPSTEGIVVKVGDKLYPAVYQAVHDEQDLALITVKATLTVVEIAEVAPAEGETVVLYGYPYNENGLKRKIGKALSKFGALRLFSSTLEPVSGDSGGGVFNEKGQLVAVNHSYVAENGIRGAQLGVHLDELRAYLKDRAAAVFPRFAARMAVNKAVKDAARNAPKDAPRTAPPPAPPVVDIKPEVKEAPKAAAPKTTIYYQQYQPGYGWVLVPYDPDCPDGRCPLQRKK